jgi:hypothetical protein
MGVGYQAGEAIVSETYGQQSYPNIVDNLLSAGIINSRSYSLWLNDLGSWEISPNMQITKLI